MTSTAMSNASSSLSLMNSPFLFGVTRWGTELFLACEMMNMPVLTSDSLKRCLPALKSGFRVSVAQDVMEEWTLHWWYELTHGFNSLIDWAACFYLCIVIVWFLWISVFVSQKGIVWRSRTIPDLKRRRNAHPRGNTQIFIFPEPCEGVFMFYKWLYIGFTLKMELCLSVARYYM